MIRALATLLVFQSAGEIASLALALPVPGPVLGMALLLAWLALRPAEAQRLRDTALALLRHLSLLFVPAGVGVMVHGHRLAAEALPIGVALVASTVLALAAAALAAHWAQRWLARRAASAPSSATDAGEPPEPR